MYKYIIYHIIPFQCLKSTCYHIQVIRKTKQGFLENLLDILHNQMSWHKVCGVYLKMSAILENWKSTSINPIPNFLTHIKRVPRLSDFYVHHGHLEINKSVLGTSVKFFVTLRKSWPSNRLLKCFIFEFSMLSSSLQPNFERRSSLEFWRYRLKLSIYVWVTV